MFANADRTGYGFHGDFIMGWTNITALQTAHQTCGPDYCPINIAGAEPGKNVQEPQILIHPAIYEEEIGLNGPVSKLPGNNPVSMLR